MKFLERIEKIIKDFEDSKAPFVYFILTFFFATTLRNFLEIFSTDIYISPLFFYHFNTSYVFLALALIILFYFATKEKIKRIAKVILPCFLILVVVPIIDLVFSGGEGLRVTYMSPENTEDLLSRFLTFFGPDFKQGITPGIRTEVVLVILGSFIYFYIKKENFIRSLFFSFLIYSLIFAYLAMPFIVQGCLKLINQEYNYSGLLLGKFYLLLIFILLVWTFYISNKKYFLEILKDIRPFRLFHFESMFFLGIILSVLLPVSVKLLQEGVSNYFNRVFIMISILFAWLFSVATNNLADCEVDKISNKKRPLISKTIPKENYKILTAIFLLLAIVYSSAVNFKTFFLTILFIGNYFLYSMPPLRLKKIPFFSKLLISLNSLVIVMIGYIFRTGSLENFPGNIILFFLIFLTAALNFIDIKDYEGDKKAGIKTLPVIFGLKRSKLIIGFFFLVAYLAAWVIIKDISFLPYLFFLGLIQFFLINRKNYKEKPVFLVYFLTIFLLIIYFTKFINIKVIGG